MERSELKTMSLFLAIGFCLISLSSKAQEIKLTSQEQKETRRAFLVANYQVLDLTYSKKLCSQSRFS
jgi:hypothetical protein